MHLNVHVWQNIQFICIIVNTRVTHSSKQSIYWVEFLFVIFFFSPYMWWNSLGTAAVWGYSTVFLWFPQVSYCHNFHLRLLNLGFGSLGSLWHDSSLVRSIAVIWGTTLVFLFNSSSDLWPLLVISSPPNAIPYLSFGEKNNTWARKNDGDKENKEWAMRSRYLILTCICSLFWIYQFLTFHVRAQVVFRACDAL